MKTKQKIVPNYNKMLKARLNKKGWWEDLEDKSKVKRRLKNGDIKRNSKGIHTKAD